ncbi:MAG: D-glycero-alpha-D-manno-heptose-1,7-bisphosphate 7-phosphatase [Terriglobales bacterium]
MRAILLDRDGVINHKAPEGEYITTIEQFRLLAGAAEAMAALGRLGFEIFVVTNQRGIARGRVSRRQLECIHDALIEAVERAGGRIRHIYVCPHDISDGCACRKPKPGMLLQAIHDYRIDPNCSWMIGDSASDMLAGQAAGFRTIFIGAPELNIPADACAGSLQSAADMIRITLDRQVARVIHL